MEVVLLIGTNVKSTNYTVIFNSQFLELKQQNTLSLFSLPSLLSIMFYYLLQVLFNLLFVESIRIYCNCLLNRKNLKSRAFPYYIGSDQQQDSNFLRYIRWSRSKYLTFGLAYIVPALFCCLVLLFVDDSLKLFIESFSLIEPPYSSLTSNQTNLLSILPSITQTPEDNYPKLGLLALCFMFTTFVLLMTVILIFIAVKGWTQHFSLGKLNDLNKLGSTSSYSNSLATNYNQLTLNSLKQNGTSGPQIPQLNTLAGLNNIDNSFLSSQLDPSLLPNSNAKRATIVLLIIVLIGQMICWMIWLAICHLNSRLNVRLDFHQFVDLEFQENSSIGGILQILIATFSVINVAQSLFILASAFHKNNKINSSSIDPTERNLFNSKLQFQKWLPICVRKTGASPLPLIGGNQLSSSALNSSASIQHIQQSQLMIQPNNGTNQQSVFFYTLDPNQLNNQPGDLNNQQNLNQPPSPIIKLNNSNLLNHHHTMMNRNSNNYLARDINTMYRPAKHNDYLLANSTTNRLLNANNINSKSQHNLAPYLQQQHQQKKPQFYSTNQRFSIPDVNPYAPPVPIDDHRLNEQLINNNLVNNGQDDYEEVMPNFNYLNSNIVQPGNSILNATNSVILNRNAQNTLRMLNNKNSSKPNSINCDNSFNNIPILNNNYNNQQQFEIEQDIYESVESPCIYTR